MKNYQAFWKDVARRCGGVARRDRFDFGAHPGHSTALILWPNAYSYAAVSIEALVGAGGGVDGQSRVDEIAQDLSEMLSQQRDCALLRRGGNGDRQ